MLHKILENNVTIVKLNLVLNIQCLLFIFYFHFKSAWTWSYGPFLSIIATFIHVRSHFPHRLIYMTLFYCGHTLVEVKLAISDRFNSLQYHKICPRCLFSIKNMILMWFVVHSYTNSSQFMITLPKYSSWIHLKHKYVHCACMWCRYSPLGNTFRNSAIMINLWWEMPKQSEGCRQITFFCKIFTTWIILWMYSI